MDPGCALSYTLHVYQPMLKEIEETNMVLDLTPDVHPYCIPTRVKKIEEINVGPRPSPEVHP